MWQKSFGGSGDDFTPSMVSKGNGTYIIAASTSSFDGDVPNNYGGSDIWIYQISVPIPLLKDTVTQSICDQDTFEFFESEYYEPGIYIDTVLQNCDSTIFTINIEAPEVQTESIELELHNDEVVFADIPYSIPGVYADTISSTFGCDSIIYSINVVDMRSDALYIPNTISQINNDQNSTLYLQGENSDITYSLSIYDKWGAPTYEKLDARVNNKSDGWSPGSFIEKGVYVYRIEYQLTDGTEKIVIGTVTLL